MSIHDKIVEVYRTNAEIRNFITKFLVPGNKGAIRPIAIQKKFPKLEPPIRYLPYNKMLNIRRLISIPDNDFGIFLKYEGEIHFHEFLFNKRILNVPGNIIKKEEFEGFIVGMSPIFDIDMRGVDNIFDKWDETMALKQHVEGMLEESGIDWNCTFTGNGINIIEEAQYFDSEDEMFECIDNLHDFIDETNTLFRTTLRPHIDPRSKNWSWYNKLPFSHNRRVNRVSIPIAKGDINRGHIKLITDLDYFCKNDKIVVPMIIKDANWNFDIL